MYALICASVNPETVFPVFVPEEVVTDGMAVLGVEAGGTEACGTDACALAEAVGTES